MPDDARAGAGDDHIVVVHLEKRFGDAYALRDVNMTVRRRNIAVIIRASGAGQTTLLRLLAGLDRPTGGAVYVDGEDFVKLGERERSRARRKFGMVFQYSALLDSMNVLDNVAFPLREHTRLREREIRKRVL